MHGVDTEVLPNTLRAFQDENLCVTQEPRLIPESQQSN